MKLRRKITPLLTVALLANVGCAHLREPTAYESLPEPSAAQPMTENEKAFWFWVSLPLALLFPNTSWPPRN